MLVGEVPTAVVTVISAKDTVEPVPIDCGKVNVILPEVAVPEAPLTKTWFAVPVSATTPVLKIVIAPVDALTDIPVEAVREVTIPLNKAPEPA
jgi:hypothetical protein